MITVSIIYPTDSDTAFDLDYYKNVHIPLIKKLLVSACQEITFGKGIGGINGQSLIYSVVCNIYSGFPEVYFESIRSTFY